MWSRIDADVDKPAVLQQGSGGGTLGPLWCAVRTMPGGANGQAFSISMLTIIHLVKMYRTTATMLV